MFFQLFDVVGLLVLVVQLWLWCLEMCGVISGYWVIFDLEQVGMFLFVFIEIILFDLVQLDNVFEFLEYFDVIEVCYFIVGDVSYMLFVCVLMLWVFEEFV